jgi:hypothetical protein
MNDRHAEVTELAAGFVLGALTHDEERLVREHLASCPEPHAEFEELGGVVPYLAETVELREPPASLRDRIMAAAAADLEARQASGVSDGPVVRDAVREAGGEAPKEPGVTHFPSATERAERSRRRSPLAWVAGLAAVLAVVVLGAWNVTLQRDLEATRAYQQGLSAVLDVAARPGSQTAILAPESGGGPTGLAAVGPDGAVAIVMRDLAPTSGSEVYEAWVIGGDGTPRPIGGFSVGPAGTAVFTASGTPATAGVTLALTREPGPGATTPTMPIISLGTTPSG